ncbi:winged helix-turn-helix transcriptional regulator [Dyella mobilis]|uniref:Helix-turn-helix transcriptional regulator n=1 Tax=Dyella mobilis TaxID=1849582 RepID=A0ABS2KC62_9GAMM|nr:helix-turn-helix domain-containing protein [Dyella mobilis]MBM7128766.1 helix-turn-helix transcriptional regulator [Dyella mobilis]GLQ99096.1 transcriptional regulator [Dyella mobilis]
MSLLEQNTFICPVELALKAIAGKWKPAILWELASGAKRFNELQGAMPGISHKVLNQQLTQLQRDGMVMHHGAELELHAGYALTPLGETLRPSLDALAQWGKLHGER